jgi:hypothetical protein
VDLEPVSTALKFGFLAILFLYLVWIARGARRDLVRSATATDDVTGIASAPASGGDAWLVVEAGGDLEPGTRFDLFGGATLGRSSEAEIRFFDQYASGIHARVYPRGGRYFIEDMNSTNGTLLNGAQVVGETELADGWTVQIGDTSFRFEAGGGVA